MHIGFNSSPTPIYGAAPVNPKMATDARAKVSSGTTDGVANVRPLSVVWAPAFFVNAAADPDKGLTSDEFASELSGVGVDADEAKKLFDSFDKSKDGSLSMNEFVDGVTADNASGKSRFQDLAMSYATNETAMNALMDKGGTAVDQYWNGIGDKSKSLIATA
ncbi:MAG: hypothetical protein JWP80_4227 [Pseudomonas sp.]|nr:hypothetical protein [Pseudomonas sp.]